MYMHVGEACVLMVTAGLLYNFPLNMYSNLDKTALYPLPRNINAKTFLLKCDLG